jgi:hypothetical protein
MVQWNPELKLEIAIGHTFRDAAPVWVDYTAYTMASEGYSIKRKRSRQLDRVETGTLQFTLLNTDGSLNPQGSWFGTALLGTPVRVSALYNAVRYYLYYGYIDDWHVNPDQSRSIVQVSCSDAFELLNNWPLTATYASHLSSARVSAVLNSVGWPAGLRSIETGQTTVQASTLTDDSVLEHLRDVVDSELGVLYQAGDGTMVFQNRYHRSVSPYNAIQATFGGVSGLPYTALDIPYDKQNLWNYIQCQRIGGAIQTATDATSELNYGRKGLSPRTNLLMTTDAEAASQASWILFRWKDPAMEIDSIVIQGKNNAALWVQMLARQPGDHIRIIRLMTGAADIDMEVIIESVSYTIKDKGNDFTLTWRCSPALFWAYWVLGVSTLGETTVLGY